MSAIGDYVHYRALNYLKHGISTKGPHLEYQSQKAKIETQLKRQFTTARKDKTLYQVETIANEMMKVINDKQKENSNPATVEEYYAGFRELFEEAMSDWFVEPYGTNAGDLRFQAGQIKQLDLAKVKHFSGINKVIEYVNQLVKLFRMELADGMTEANYFLDLGNSFLEHLVVLQNRLEIARVETNQASKTAKYKSINTSWKDLSHFFGVLKTMHQAAREIPETYAINEFITKDIQKLLPKKAHEEAAEMLKQASKLVLTNTNINSQVRQDNVTASIDRFKNTILRAITNNDGLVFNLSWTENDDLVDFIFLQDPSFSSVIKKSFKLGNYQTNIGLLEMLQETNHDNSYITHFLNVFAGRLGAAPSVIKTHRLAMIEELKVASLYTLMRTNDLNPLKKHKRADIIFQYDNDAKKVHAKSIYSILEDVYTDMEMLEVLMDGKSIDVDFRRFPNRFWGDRQVPSYSDAYRRVANLLADAHQRKLSILIRV